VPDTRLADRQHRCQRPPARRHRPPSGRTGLARTRLPASPQYQS